MTQSDLHFTGMPYAPGMAHGVLQRGMYGDPTGRIVMLSTPGMSLSGRTRSFRFR